MLAGIPRSPASYWPLRNPDRAKERQAAVLNRMVKLGWLSAEDAEKAKQEPIKLRRPMPAGPAASSLDEILDTC
jgi:penicillin-binding protein 1A